MGLYFYLSLRSSTTLLPNNRVKPTISRERLRFTLGNIEFVEVSKTRMKANAFLYMSYFALFSAFFYTIRNKIYLQHIPLHDTVKIRINFVIANILDFLQKPTLSFLLNLTKPPSCCICNAAELFFNASIGLQIR